MKKISAPPRGTQGRTKKFEEWLIPDTIPDAEGQEHSVSDLLARSRRDYQSVTVKKNLQVRKPYARYTRQELEWIYKTDVDIVQYQMQLTREQARSLKLRAYYHICGRDQ